MARYNLAYGKGLRPDQIERVWLLTGLGKTPYEIAKDLGISADSLREYLRSVTETPQNVKKRLTAVRANKSRAYAEFFKAKAVEVASSLDAEVIGKLSGAQRALVLGILTDKAKVFEDMACRLEDKFDEVSGQSDGGSQHRTIGDILTSLTGKVEKLTFLQIDLPSPLRAKLEDIKAAQAALEVVPLAPAETLLLNDPLATAAPAGIPTRDQPSEHQPEGGETNHSPV
jgi:hypothetical protein